MRLKLIVCLCLSFFKAISAADSLLELSCKSDDQCQVYENAKCRDSHCICTESKSGKDVPCQPKDQKLSNIIGGPCTPEQTCTQQHAECDNTTQQCFCAAGYIPSKERRRCLPQKVALGGHCEMMSQCQLADKSAVCHTSTCRCKDQFETHDGHCLALLQLTCITDDNCTRVKDAICLPEWKKCACIVGSVHNPNQTICMPAASYGSTCTTNAQCQLMLGVPSLCLNNTCSCRPKHYPKIQKDATSCEPIVEYGAYCRQDKDCEQQVKGQELKPSMRCKWGECVCRDQYHVVDNESCVLNASSLSVHQGNLHQMLASMFFIWFIYFSI